MDWEGNVCHCRLLLCVKGALSSFSSQYLQAVSIFNSRHTTLQEKFYPWQLHSAFRSVPNTQRSLTYKEKNCSLLCRRQHMELDGSDASVVFPWLTWTLGKMWNSRSVQWIFGFYLSVFCFLLWIFCYFVWPTLYRTQWKSYYQDMKGDKIMQSFHRGRWHTMTWMVNGVIPSLITSKDS